MSKNTKNYLILPACLLWLNVIEEVIVYKAQNYPAIATNPYLLTLVIILLFAIGFALVGNVIAPYFQSLFEQAHKGSKKHGGDMGIIIFYVITAGLTFFVYFRIYTMGPQMILPPGWR